MLWFVNLHMQNFCQESFCQESCHVVVCHIPQDTTAARSLCHAVVCHISHDTQRTAASFSVIVVCHIPHDMHSPAARSFCHAVVCHLPHDTKYKQNCCQEFFCHAVVCHVPHDTCRITARVFLSCYSLPRSTWHRTTDRSLLAMSLCAGLWSVWTPSDPLAAPAASWEAAPQKPRSDWQPQTQNGERRFSTPLGGVGASQQHMLPQEPEHEITHTITSQFS